LSFRGHLQAEFIAPLIETERRALPLVIDRKNWIEQDRQRRRATPRLPYVGAAIFIVSFSKLSPGHWKSLRFVETSRVHHVARASETPVQLRTVRLAPSHVGGLQRRAAASGKTIVLVAPPLPLPTCGRRRPAEE
jgi:hypothetical protein